MHDITLRIMSPADIEAGLRLTRSAGWNQLRRDWEMFLEQSPEGCYVAERGGKVIGTAGTIRYQEQFSWIGMVLVDPVDRGRGIGRQLFKTALNSLAAERCVRLDATPAGEKLYRKFDFHEEFGIRRLEAHVSDSATGYLARPLARKDLPAIGSLDFQAFGADRSFLLQWMWEGAPDYAWVVEGPAGIEGYLLGRRGFGFEHLGPIVARSVEMAGDLVAGCLGRMRDRRVIIDARHEPEWLKLLSKLGFREQRPFIRMFRGEEARPPRSEAQWAFLGPEFG